MFLCFANCYYRRVRNNSLFFRFWFVMIRSEIWIHIMKVYCYNDLLNAASFPIEISDITFFSQYNGNDHIYLFQRLTVKSEPNSKNIKIDDFRFFSLHFFTQTSLCLRYKLYGLLTDSLTHFAFCEEQRSYKIRFDLP